MSKKHERNAEQSAIRRNWPARRLNMLRLGKGSFAGIEPKRDPPKSARAKAQPASPEQGQFRRGLFHQRFLHFFGNYCRFRLLIRIKI